MLFRLPWVIPHSTTTISNSSFCFTFTYRSITVEFLQVASPVRISTRATCCAQMPLSVVAHVRDRVSELLSLSPSLPLSFSLSFFSLSLVFLSVPLFSSHHLFPMLSFFLRCLLSSFSRLPRATECPSSATCLRCMFSWWYEGLKRRTLLLRSNAASLLR